MAKTVNPINFRLPFESQIKDMPEHHQAVIRNLFNANTDTQKAIASLKDQITALQNKSK